MRLRCCRKREYREFDISEFAVIKSEQKYVIGVMPGGDEWFLPHKSSLGGVESAVPDLMRVSRSVLVARQCVLGVSGRSKTRMVHTTAGEYRLSRLTPLGPVLAVIQENQARHLGGSDGVSSRAEPGSEVQRNENVR